MFVLKKEKNQGDNSPWGPAPPTIMDGHQVVIRLVIKLKYKVVIRWALKS
jgi:hypothetical protein